MTSPRKTIWTPLTVTSQDKNTKKSILMTMPTSSQARILKCGDDGGTTRTSHQWVYPKRYYPEFKMCDRKKIKGPRQPSSDKEISEGSIRRRCEIVKFDFNVITHEPSVDGIEGVFAYDDKTNSYRWKINSVTPRRPYDPRHLSRNPSGDNSLNMKKDSSDDDDSETSGSFVHEQTSEMTQHFTTPAVSLMDTSNNKNNISHNTELHGCAKPLKPLDIPNDSESLDDATYRQLEELGFRRRTTYSPGGSLVRMKKEKCSLRSPTKSDVSSLLQDPTPKLTINNLDPMKVPPPCRVPYKRQGFTPTLFVKEDTKKPRVRSVKHTSLLDDVKKSVNWDRRVAPAMILRRGPMNAEPNAICFSLRKTFDFSHSDVKELIEFKFKTKVKTLQYDPVSVRVSDPNTFDRWVVTLTSKADCTKVIQQGLTMDDDKVVIRFWDEVLREETVTDDKIGWGYSCRSRLQQERHNQVLSNFLAVH